MYTTRRNNEFSDSNLDADSDNDANPDTSVEISLVGLSKTQGVDNLIDLVGDLPKTDNNMKKSHPKKVTKKKRKVCMQKVQQHASWVCKQKKWRNDCKYWRRQVDGFEYERNLAVK